VLVVGDHHVLVAQGAFNVEHLVGMELQSHAQLLRVHEVAGTERVHPEAVLLPASRLHLPEAEMAQGQVLTR
jgi:hypothetical protein